MRKNNNFLQKAVIDYLGSKCAECGSTENLNIHHVIPLYIGGYNTIGNMELLCHSCHKKVHASAWKIFPSKRREKEELCKICGNPRDFSRHEALCKKCKSIKNRERYLKLKDDKIP